MSLYYQDDEITLYHGDSMDVLLGIDTPVDVLLADPPYFKVKQDEWDNQWDKAGEFLGWMGDWLDHAKPLLVDNASVWVFASPAMTSSVERLVGERFRVLNSIRWVKEAGWHQKADLPKMRRYLTPWEGIVFAEQDLIICPVGDYLKSERERAGWNRSDLEVALGYASKANPRRGTALAYRWENGTRGYCIPTEIDYLRMRDLYGPGHLGREHSDLLEDHEQKRRPFTITDRAASTDVWTFPPVRPYPGKHPCEKPQDMLTHMIETSSRPGWTILDPFAGSGSTLLAARNSGRKAIGIEKDEAWCEKIALRLSAETLPIKAA